MHRVLYISILLLAGGISCAKRAKSTETDAGKMVNRGSFNEVISRHQGEVQKCYEKGLLADGTLAGSVAVEILYNKDGQVTQCHVRQHMADHAVGECICTSSRRWRFSSSFEAQNRGTYTWTLKPLKAKVTMGLAAADLQVIQKGQSEVVKCYEAALKNNRSLQGAVGVTIFLAGDGKVKQCTLSKNLQEATSVGACICESISSWKFAPPERPNKVITYTWNLKPQVQE